MYKSAAAKFFRLSRLSHGFKLEAAVLPYASIKAESKKSSKCCFQFRDRCWCLWRCCVCDWMGVYCSKKAKVSQLKPAQISFSSDRANRLFNSTLRIWLRETLWWMSWHICDHYFRNLLRKSIVFAPAAWGADTHECFIYLFKHKDLKNHSLLANEWSVRLWSTRGSDYLQMSLGLFPVHIQPAAQCAESISEGA